MNKLIISILMTSLFLFSNGCKEDKPLDLPSLAAQIQSITVYDLGLSSSKYSEEDLNKATHASLDPNTFKELAGYAKYKKDGGVIWKGSSLAIAKLKDGTEIRLTLSYYGAFFTINDEYGCFYFEGEHRTKWEQVYLKEIIQDKFVPKR